MREHTQISRKLFLRIFVSLFCYLSSELYLLSPIQFICQLLLKKCSVSIQVNNINLNMLASCFSSTYGQSQIAQKILVNKYVEKVNKSQTIIVGDCSEAGADFSGSE